MTIFSNYYHLPIPYHRINIARSTFGRTDEKQELSSTAAEG